MTTCASSSSSVGAEEPQDQQHLRLRRGLQQQQAPAAQPSCPGQQPCPTMMPAAVPSYMVYRIDDADDGDGTCSQVCAGGAFLAARLDSGYECGTCFRYFDSICPVQQDPCYDFGNGFLGYNIYSVGDDSSEGSTCVQRCTAGNALVNYIKSGEYSCGRCPERTPPVPPVQPAPPSCPGQTPCRMFGSFPGYRVHKISAADGTCSGACAASTSLTRLLQNDGYRCGPCEWPKCPGQTPCGQFYGIDAYTLVPADDTAEEPCREMCAAGNAILSRQFAKTWKCGRCS